MRKAWSTAEPVPVASAGSAPSAVSIDVGSDRPRPTPQTAVHAAENPAPSPSPVLAPQASPVASTTIPAATTGPAPTRCAISPDGMAVTSIPAISGSSRSPLP